MIRVAIFNDTRTETKHFGCSIVMRNIEYSLESLNILPVWYWKAGTDWRDFTNQLPQKGSIDAIIVNGEGTMHHSDQKILTHALAEVAVLANDILNVPAYLINTTFFMNSPDFYKKISHFDGIYVRDTFSIEQLSLNGVQGKHVPDMTFSMKISYGYQIIRSGYGATDSIYGEISKQIGTFAKNRGWEFYKMVVPRISKNKLYEFVYPNIFLKKIKLFFDNYYFNNHCSFQSSDKFIEWLSSKKLIVTGRYHTVTLCLITKTPFIAIESNTPKISALLKDVFGSTDRVVNSVCNISPSMLETYETYTKDELLAIDNFLNYAASANQKMFEEIYLKIFTRTFNN